MKQHPQEPNDGFENLLEQVQFWCFCAFWTAVLLFIGGAIGAVVLLRMGY